MNASVRVRLVLGYDGTAFAGWAAQPGQRTVEGTLTEALGRILRLDPAPRLTVAGRTDAGVHARAQVAHVDVPEDAWARLPGRSGREPGEAMRRRLDAVLPPDIRITAAGVVPADFDARFAALRRHYRYRIADAHAPHDPLRRHDTLWLDEALDVAAMGEAGRSLLGLHDFAAYCRRREGASTIRSLQRCEVTRDGDGVVLAELSADAFCHSMVRALVGALVGVGQGRYAANLPAEILADGARDPRVKVLAAHGLTLVRVDYPEADRWAARVAQARSRRD